MPHIFIEFSANVADHHDIDALVVAVHTAALTDGLPPVDGLRTRAMARDHFRIADGHPDYAFVALTARIGPGRQSETKLRFLTALLDAAEQQLARTDHPLAIAWSAEIQEIDADFRINRNHVRTRMHEGA